MQEGMWRVLQGGRYSRRKADRYSHGSGGSRYCKSGEGSWTSQLPQSSPPQILVYSIYTNTQEKKKEREARMRNKSDKACFLSRPIKKKKRNRFDSNGTKGKGRSKINKACWVARRSLFTNKSTVVFTPVIAYFSMTPNTTDLSSDLLSVHTCVCMCVLSCPQLAGRGL